MSQRRLATRCWPAGRAARQLIRGAAPRDPAVNPVFGESNSFPPTWWLLERYIGVNSLTIPDIGKQVRTQARPTGVLGRGALLQSPKSGPRPPDARRARNQPSGADRQAGRRAEAISGVKLRRIAQMLDELWDELNGYR